MAEGSSTTRSWSLPTACTLPVVVAVAALVAAPTAAEDTVHISNPSSARGYAEWKGQVLDYTGGELRLRLPGGVERRFPADRVLGIETQYSTRQVEADKRFAENEYAAALALYDEARKSEERRWVQREITAKMVWCCRALGDSESAGREFLGLVQDDPRTPYFSCIPLAWVPSQPPLGLEQAATEWLRLEQMPAAVLLGASHLMSTASRPKALDKLNRLAADPDGRIALLALAQTWRAAVVTADERQLADWQATIERMPESLRAGPYYVLGLARAQRQQWDGAALAWLRVPVLYPEHRVLAARSLVEAGRVLEGLGRSEQAARLYDEVVNRYSKTPSEAEARARLEEMREKMNDE